MFCKIGALKIFSSHRSTCDGVSFQNMYVLYACSMYWHLRSLMSELILLSFSGLFNRIPNNCSINHWKLARCHTHNKKYSNDRDSVYGDPNYIKNQEDFSEMDQLKGVVDGFGKLSAFLGTPKSKATIFSTRHYNTSNNAVMALRRISIWRNEL